MPYGEWVSQSALLAKFVAFKMAIIGQNWWLMHISAVNLLIIRFFLTVKMTFYLPDFQLKDLNWENMRFVWWVASSTKCSWWLFVKDCLLWMIWRICMFSESQTFLQTACALSLSDLSWAVMKQTLWNFLAGTILSFIHLSAEMTENKDFRMIWICFFHLKRY